MFLLRIIRAEQRQWVVRSLMLRKEKTELRYESKECNIKLFVLIFLLVYFKNLKTVIKIIAIIKKLMYTKTLCHLCDTYYNRLQVLILV